MIYFNPLPKKNKGHLITNQGNEMKNKNENGINYTTLLAVSSRVLTQNDGEITASIVCLRFGADRSDYDIPPESGKVYGIKGTGVKPRFVQLNFPNPSAETMAICTAKDKENEFPRWIHIPATSWESVDAVSGETSRKKGITLSLKITDISVIKFGETIAPPVDF